MESEYPLLLPLCFSTCQDELGSSPNRISSVFLPLYYIPPYSPICPFPLLVLKTQYRASFFLARSSPGGLLYPPCLTFRIPSAFCYVSSHTSFLFFLHLVSGRCQARQSKPPVSRHPSNVANISLSLFLFFSLCLSFLPIYLNPICLTPHCCLRDSPPILFLETSL